MHRYDRLGGLLWMAIGIAICIGSIRLGPGSVSAPGPGLIPLGCGLLLAALGLALSLFHHRTDPARREAPREKRLSWHRMVVALGYLVAYALLLDVLGFLVVTALWVGANCRLGRTSWGKTVIISVIATLSSYLVFDYLLKVRLPRGIWGL
jgi:putative tricarboxylic transport membrane protein